LSDIAGTLTAACGRRDVDRLERDPAVVDQDPVPGAGVRRESLVRRRAAAFVTDDRLGGDGELGAAVQRHGAVGECAEPDLGALQVDHNGDRATGGVGGGPHSGVPGGVLGVRAVGEVEPGDVHAGRGQFADPLRAVGGRPERADDLRTAGHRLSLATPAGRTPQRRRS
jgi:hypothetical protein